MRTLIGSRWGIYHDPSDWWVGAYFGDRHVYVCVIPTIVLRIRRKRVS